MNNVEKYKKCIKTLRYDPKVCITTGDCKNCECYLPNDVFHDISVEIIGRGV